jgi:hypothetical protein
MDIHQFMGMALDFAKAYHRVQKEGAEAVGQWGVVMDRFMSTAEGLLAASKAGDPTKAVADRDREWIEAIAPGSSNTEFGRWYSTPGKYAELAKARLELDTSENAFLAAKISHLLRLLSELRDACNTVVSANGTAGSIRRHVLPLYNNLVMTEARAKELLPPEGQGNPLSVLLGRNSLGRIMGSVRYSVVEAIHLWMNHVAGRELDLHAQGTHVDVIDSDSGCTSRARVDLVGRNPDNAIGDQLYLVLCDQYENQVCLTQEDWDGIGTDDLLAVLRAVEDAFGPANKEH